MEAVDGLVDRSEVGGHAVAKQFRTEKEGPADLIRKLILPVEIGHSSVQFYALRGQRVKNAHFCLPRCNGCGDGGAHHAAQRRGDRVKAPDRDSFGTHIQRKRTVVVFQKDAAFGGDGHSQFTLSGIQLGYRAKLCFVISCVGD